MNRRNRSRARGTGRVAPHQCVVLQVGRLRYDFEHSQSEIHRNADQLPDDHARRAARCAWRCRGRGEAGLKLSVGDLSIEASAPDVVCGRELFLCFKSLEVGDREGSEPLAVTLNVPGNISLIRQARLPQRCEERSIIGSGVVVPCAAKRTASRVRISTVNVCLAGR